MRWEWEPAVLRYGILLYREAKRVSIGLLCSDVGIVWHRGAKPA